MTIVSIIAGAAIIIFLLVVRDFCKFQRKYYSQRVHVRKPNRAQYRAADKKKRKRERQQRRAARRRG